MINDNDAWEKNEKFLKITLKITLKMQNMLFSRLKQVAKKSLRPVARDLKQKFWKFFCVFRDWKFYPRGSRDISRENLYVPFVAKPSTRKQVTRLSREKF